MNKLRAWHLKRRARKLYEGYAAHRDGFGCGGHLANHISGGRTNRIARSFNATMDSLAKIDPDTPKERLQVFD